MQKLLDQTKVYSDAKLKLKYQILNKIGQGCFGVIYKAINRIMKRQIALKLEFLEEGDHLHSKKSSIGNQIAVLDRLKGVAGVPKLYAAGKWNCGYYMEIQLLSSSLNDEKDKQFTFQQICTMTGQLIQILKNIHRRKVIHQDLKPQNIMRNQKGAFYIIDFGLSSILSQENQITEQKQKRRGFIGTPRYASLAAHTGLPQKPKDDIQSLLYVVGSLYMKKAPWFELKGPAAKRLQRIQKIKQANSLIWLKQIGHCFALCHQYLRQLSPTEEPNYSYLVTLFHNSRKSTTIKSLSPTFKQEQINLNRRRSDADFQMMNFPTINIHTVEKSKIDNIINEDHKYLAKDDRVTTLGLKDQHEDISASQTNLSQIAHSSYMNLLHILTEKIFTTTQFHEPSPNSKTHNEPRTLTYHQIPNQNQNPHSDSEPTKTLKSKLTYAETENVEESIFGNSSNCKEPAINCISKYEGLCFKNPFTGY